MTDELLGDACATVLYLRDALELHKGAITQHILAHDRKPIECDGYRFHLKPAEPACAVCAEKWRATFPPTAYYLSITKIEKGKRAAA